MKDEETTTFDGKTLLEYTTDRSIWPSKHNAYVVGVSTDNDEDEDDNDDDQELPDDPPETASGPADDLFPTGDDAFVTFIEQLDEGAGGNVYNVLRSAFLYDCAERPTAAVLLRNFEEIVFE